MRHLRKRPCTNLAPIFFIVEGRQRPYRCDCGSREFEIGEDVGGYTALTCSYRKRHVVITGFTVGAVDYERETVWLGKTIHGIQLPLLFPTWLQIGNVPKRVSRWMAQRGGA